MTFLKSLPKYKLIPFNKHFGENEDNELKKHTSYALLYFGDGKTPEVGKEGSFNSLKAIKLGLWFVQKQMQKVVKNRVSSISMVV